MHSSEFSDYIKVTRYKEYVHQIIERKFHMIIYCDTVENDAPSLTVLL